MSLVNLAPVERSCGGKEGCEGRNESEGTQDPGQEFSKDHLQKLTFQNGHSEMVSFILHSVQERQMEKSLQKLASFERTPCKERSLETFQKGFYSNVFTAHMTVECFDMSLIPFTHPS